MSERPESQGKDQWMNRALTLLNDRRTVLAVISMIETEPKTPKGDARSKIDNSLKAIFENALKGELPNSDQLLEETQYYNQPLYGAICDIAGRESEHLLLVYLGNSSLKTASEEDFIKGLKEYYST
jgi:hypothetical protein